MLRLSAYLIYLGVSLALIACQSIPKNTIDDSFQQRVADYQKQNPEINYEDAAFRLNSNHFKEVRRVERCSRAQEGFEDRAVYQIPPDYELHFYFLGAAQEKLAACTLDPIFKAHNVPYSVEEIMNVQSQAIKGLSEAGLTYTSEINGHSHTLFYKKPHPETLLSKHAHIMIAVEEDDIALARSVLAPFTVFGGSLLMIIYMGLFGHNVRYPEGENYKKMSIEGYRNLGSRNPIQKLFTTHYHAKIYHVKDHCPIPDDGRNPNRDYVIATYEKAFGLTHSIVYHNCGYGKFWGDPQPEWELSKSKLVAKS